MYSQGCGGSSPFDGTNLEIEVLPPMPALRLAVGGQDFASGLPPATVHGKHKVPPLRLLSLRFRRDDKCGCFRCVLDGTTDGRWMLDLDVKKAISCEIAFLQ
jgi:hypothetical protein